MIGRTEHHVISDRARNARVLRYTQVKGRLWSGYFLGDPTGRGFTGTTMHKLFDAARVAVDDVFPVVKESANSGR